MKNALIKTCFECGKGFEAHGNWMSCSKECSEKHRLWRCRMQARRYRKEHRLTPQFRDKRRAHSKLYYQKHKKKMNEQIYNHYRRNKQQWHSRSVTNAIIKLGEFPKTPCRYCGVDDVELHHEIYPTARMEIRQAFKDGKIYWVCRYCHRLKLHEK